MDLSVIQVAVIILAPILGGAVKGIAGFGFSFVGTSILATTYDGSFAVSAFILPLMLVELELLNKLTLTEIKTCGISLRYYVAASALGTVVGVLLLGIIPSRAIKALLGASAVFYGVHTKTGILKKFPSIFSGTKTEKAILGGLSGVFFGATNVGVQFVAYVKSLQLGRRKFLGVLAMIVLGVSSLRLAASIFAGYFGGIQGLGISSAMAVLSVVSVFVSTRLGKRIDPVVRDDSASLLLVIVGLYLVAIQFI